VKFTPPSLGLVPSRFVNQGSDAEAREASQENFSLTSDVLLLGLEFLLHPSP
jgi:hypothetical protein